MGITKEGDALVGTIMGGVSASRLSPEQRATLRSEYGLDSDASLTARNAGRGFLGGAAGALAGRAIGTLGGLPGRIVAPIALGVGGGYAATRKYSKGNPLLNKDKTQKLLPAA